MSGGSGWYPSRPELAGRPSFPFWCRTMVELPGTAKRGTTGMSRLLGRSGSPSRQTPNRYHPIFKNGIKKKVCENGGTEKPREPISGPSQQ